MPLYEYECKRCHFRFERIQKFSDRLVRKCPKCKTGRVEKLLSAPAVQFKGTGWYVTDYAAKKGGGEKGDSDKGGEKGDKGDSGGKSESSSSGKESSEKSSGSEKKDSPSSDKSSSGKSGKSSKP